MFVSKGTSFNVDNYMLMFNVNDYMEGKLILCKHCMHTDGWTPCDDFMPFQQYFSHIRKTKG